MTREPKCPMCQRPVLSTSYINLDVGELYSDVNTQPSPRAASPSPQFKQPSPAVNQFAGYGPRNSPNMKPDKASERANKLRALVAQTGKHETVLQTAVSWLVNQGYDEGNVFDALLQSNGDRDKAAKILESGNLQRKASVPPFLFSHPNANTFGNSNFPIARSNSDIGNDGSPLRPPSQVFNGVPMDTSTRVGYSIPKEGSYQKSSPNFRPHPNVNPFGNFDPSAWKGRHINGPSGSPQRPQAKMFNGVPPDPKDKASERANKLRALVAQTGKHEKFLQIAVLYLTNMGYDEDSVYDALMKSNGDRDEAQKDLERRGEQRTNSDPAFPKIPDSLPRKVSVPILPKKSPMNPRYGSRNSPNIRPDKATERAQRLRDLSARTSKHENVLQTAVSFLVTQGYEEEKVFQALMESDGDRDKAARILAGSSP